MPNAAFILIAYLIGSLPFAVIVSKALGLPDPRSYGSGNPGATNVLRTGRKLAALLTLAGDGGKGWLAVFLAVRYGVDTIGVAAVALATRYASLASMVAAVLAPVFAYFMSAQASTVVALAAIAALIVWRHKAN